MKKGIWKGFRKSFLTGFPCPNCPSGILRLSKDGFQSRRPRNPSFDEYEQNPSDYPVVFTMLLHCSKCDEVVGVLGSSTEYPEEGHDGGVNYYEFLEPRYMWPAPPIINLDKRVPEPVKTEIRLAFHLFWVDYGVCASRLRTSLERLMDHFGVARTRIRTNPNGPGKRVPLELASRIDKLPSKIGTRDYSEILHALRTVGNLGAHGGKLPREAMLDAFKLYEMALDKLFEDQSETAKAIIKRLRSHK